MKKYSDVSKLYELFGTDDVQFEIIDEGVLTDFVKVFKDKYFNNTIFVTSEKMNHLKYVFIVSLVKSLDHLKFKGISFTKLLFNPKDVITAMQKDLLGVIEKEKNGDILRGSVFNFRKKYRSNTSLLLECTEMVDLLERGMKSNLDGYITSVFKVGYDNDKNLRDKNTFIKKFKELFETIFKREDENQGKSKNADIKSNSNKNKLEELSVKVLKELEKQIDVKYGNIFVMDNEEDLEKVPSEKATIKQKLPSEEEKDDTPDELKVDTDIKKDEPYDLDVTKLTTRQLLDAVKSFGRKYNISVDATEIHGKYKPIFLDAYKEAFKEKGKPPSETEIVLKMKDIYDKKYGSAA